MRNVEERHAQRVAEFEARHGLVNGGVYLARDGDPTRYCRLSVEGRPRLTWYVAELRGPTGPEIPASRVLLTKSLRDRLEPVSP